ncbi:MAG TPA: branched-chain amino acid ABC transporter permease, partial [Conexibacter sp.]|nr:branched-chain amino acid ABC transporter permease [Conexibacter sp.]
MTDLLQSAVDTLSIGGLFAIIALALALLFSVMNLMNFAYGELIMVGGYTMYFTRDLPWPAMVVAAILAVIVASVLLERVAFRPLRGAEPLTLLISSFAVSIGLQSAARMLAGANPKGLEPFPALNDVIVIGSVRILALDVVIIGTTIAVLVGMIYLLERTDLGMMLRASA